MRKYYPLNSSKEIVDYPVLQIRLTEYPQYYISSECLHLFGFRFHVTKKERYLLFIGFHLHSMLNEVNRPSYFERRKSV